MTSALAWASIAGTVVFAATVVTLHVLRRDLPPAHHFISEYARGQHGWLMTAAFFALAGAGAALAGTRLLVAGVGALPVAATLVAWSAGLVGAGLFPTDPNTPGAEVTSAGRRHNTGAAWAFRSICAAAVLLSVERYGAGPGEVGLMLVGGVAVLAGYVLLTRGSRWVAVGTAQRLFVGVVLLWLLSVAASHLR